ncbi:MAG: iron-containing alcohol dehydrogenase [Patescibacteria group bacterium]
MNDFELSLPTRIFFGRGAIRHLGHAAAACGRSALVVYGQTSARRSGLVDEVLARLRAEGITAEELGGVEPNPRITSARKGAELCKSRGIELVLAIGGGSAIDCAKAVAAGAAYEGDPWDFFCGRAEVKKALPVGAILTLAAAGSEMNGNSVMTNPATLEKRAAGSPLWRPRFSILDPSYTMSVPRAQTVNGIVDIMVHVLEQYLNLTPAVPLQDRLAEGILLTAIENAPLVLADPHDYDARANLMWCGSMAINGLIAAGVDEDWATHGIEHAVSAVHDIAHAAGLAVIWPRWAEYVLPAGAGKFAQYAARVWGIEERDSLRAARAGIAATGDFFTRLGAPATLAQAGVVEPDLDLLARKATAAGPIGTYRRLGFEDVREILRRCL